MKRFIPKTSDGYYTIIGECRDYIQNQIDEYGLEDEDTETEQWMVDEIQGYRSELGKLDDGNIRWIELLNSGICHDAVGKYVGEKKGFVAFEDEY